MDGPRWYYAQGNKSEKDTCHVVLLICDNLKSKVNEQTKLKQTHRYRKQMVARGEVNWGSGWKR